MPQIIEITDLSRPELDVFCRLTEAQLRNRLEPEKGVFIAESPTVIGLAPVMSRWPSLPSVNLLKGRQLGSLHAAGRFPFTPGNGRYWQG